MSYNTNAKKSSSIFDNNLLTPNPFRDKVTLLPSSSGLNVKANSPQKSQIDLGPISQIYLRSGPVEVRQCTDLICCLIYVLFLIGVLGLSVFAIIKGNPVKLITPHDSSHRACGEGELKDYPFIYFVSPQANFLWRTTCVKACPSANNSLLFECANNTIVPTCEANESTVASEQIMIYDSEPLWKMCFPQDENLTKSIAGAVEAAEILSSLGDSIANTWRSTTISIGLGFLLVLFVVIFLTVIPVFITWFIIVMYLLSLIAMGSLCLYRYFYPRVIKTSWGNAYIHQFLESPTFSIIWAGVFYFLALLSLIIILVNIKKIRFAISFIKTTALFFKDNWSIILIPTISFLICIILLLSFSWVSTYLWSIGETSKDPFALPFSHIDQNKNLWRFLIIILLSFFVWNLSIVVGVRDYIIMNSGALWYFSQSSSEEINSVYTVKKSVYNMLRYHFGSVSLGSIMLSLFGPLNSMFGSLYNKFASMRDEAEEDSCKKISLKLCLCCFDCYERFLRIFHVGAYFQMSMTGKGFCSSASDNFYLIYRNRDKYSIISGLADMVLFFAYMFITFTPCILYYSMVTWIPEFRKDIPFIVFPLTVVALISLFLSEIFLKVFSISFESIILAYLIDEEIDLYHYGKNEAVNCPSTLKGLMRELQASIS